MNLVCFYLFMSSSVSFISVISVSKYMFLPPWWDLLLGIFIISELIVSGIVLITVSDSLLVYKNITDFSY